MEHGLFGWLFLIGGVMLLFGNPKRFSDLGRGMGSFLREFKAAQREDVVPESKPATAEAPKLTQAPQEKTEAPK